MAAPMRLSALVEKSKIFSFRNLAACLLTCRHDVQISDIPSRCIWTRLNVHHETFPHICKRFAERCGKRTCWNCGNNVTSSDLQCQSCQCLQEVNKDQNYFQVFGETARYDLDESKLQTSFRNLQRALHPDKFSAKSEKERQLSDGHSALVNQAYQTLSKPEKRAGYLLRLWGKDLDAVQLDSNFLAYMMELNEQVAEETKTARLIMTEVRANLKRLTAELSSSFAKQELDKACEILAKIRYFRNIEAKLKESMGDSA